MRIANWAALVTACTLGILPSLATEKQSANELWEKAVEAQGGHARLQAIESILVSISFGKETNRTVQQLLLVPPRQVRIWDDTHRPKAPDLVDVWSPVDGKTCLLQSGDSTPTWTQIENVDSEYGRIVGETLPFILESKSVRPVVHGVRPGRVGRKHVNVLTATAEGRTVEFSLDLETSLPLRVFFPDWKEPDITILSYREVGGIKVPRKVEINFFGRRVIAFYSVEFNTAYDQSIFKCTSHGRLR